MEELKTISESGQYIVVRIGEEQYGINIKDIDNIVRMQHVTRVPKVKKYLKGVINIRGEVIPVMSMRIKMGLPEDEYTKDTRIIIIKLEQLGMLGVIVDSVKEVVTLEDDQIEKTAGLSAKDGKENFLLGVGKMENQLVSLLDLNALTAEKETN